MTGKRASAAALLEPVTTSVRTPVMSEDRQSATSDESLALRARDGDRLAFDLLVRRYRKPLASYLYGLLRDYERALELSQETFLRLYQNAGRYEPGSKFTTWMYR